MRVSLAVFGAVLVLAIGGCSDAPSSAPQGGGPELIVWCGMMSHPYISEVKDGATAAENEFGLPQNTHRMIDPSCLKNANRKPQKQRGFRGYYKPIPTLTRPEKIPTFAEDIHSSCLFPAGDWMLRERRC
jgi:hypothetical protein